MMPLKVDLGPRARRDVFAIWDHIAQDSPRAADATLRRIDKVVQHLAHNPETGRPRPELGAEIRSFPAIDSYLVYYRYSTTSLSVLRILHAARDIKP